MKWNHFGQVGYFHTPSYGHDETVSKPKHIFPAMAFIIASCILAVCPFNAYSFNIPCSVKYFLAISHILYHTSALAHGGVELEGVLPLFRYSGHLWSALSSAYVFDSYIAKQYGPRSDCSHRSSLILVHSASLNG